MPSGGQTVRCGGRGRRGVHATVDGEAIRAPAILDDDSRSPVDVDTSCSTSGRCGRSPGPATRSRSSRSMDGRVPVDIEVLAVSRAGSMQWMFRESQTFGPHVEDFHKTTYQSPPDGGLISQAAAAYRDTATAQRAFDDLAIWSRMRSTDIRTHVRR